MERSKTIIFTQPDPAEVRATWTGFMAQEDLIVPGYGRYSYWDIAQALHAVEFIKTNRTLLHKRGFQRRMKKAGCNGIV